MHLILHGNYIFLLIMDLTFTSTSTGLWKIMARKMQRYIAKRLVAATGYILKYTGVKSRSGRLLPAYSA